MSDSTHPAPPATEVDLDGIRKELQSPPKNCPACGSSDVRTRDNFVRVPTLEYPDGHLVPDGNWRLDCRACKKGWIEPQVWSPAPILPVPNATPLPVADWWKLLRDVADDLDAHYGVAEGETMVTAQDVRALADYLPQLPALLSLVERLKRERDEALTLGNIVANEAAKILNGQPVAQQLGKAILDFQFLETRKNLLTVPIGQTHV